MLSNVNNASIYDSKFTTRINQQVNFNYALASNRGLDTLKAAVAISAFHNSEERFDPPKCHSHTREAVLARIMRWVRREIDPDKPIMWVYGAAGTGKSAIEQTIAELFDAEDGDIFVCSFFFSRADGSRNHSKAFVATIAYQMAVATPSLRPLIDAAVERDSLLLSRSLEVQMTRLIIQPFQRLLAESEAFGRYLLIVDGLDECMDGSRIQLIEEVQRLVTVLGQDSRFIASFASRPEPDIKSTFQYTFVSDMLTRVALDDDYRADDDIRLFLSEKFAAIQRTRPRIPKTWPTENQLETLVQNASGQFIYALTVYNFISSPHHNPVKRLDMVLGLALTNGSTPFAQLDALYRQILLSAPPDCVNEGIRVVATLHIMCSLHPLARISVASRIMELEEYDFMTHLDNYASIICVRDDGCAQALHASLGDFLFDPERSSDLYIDPSTEHATIFASLMRYLASTSWEREIWDNQKAPFLSYAFIYYSDYFFRARRTLSLLEHLRLVFKPSFLENVTNPPASSSWPLSYRVLRAVRFFFSIKMRILPDLKDPNIEKECWDAIGQLITTFLVKDSAKNIRMLKLLVAIDFHSLPRVYPCSQISSAFRTLFCHEKVLDELSGEHLILGYFNDPLVPVTQRCLQPSDYVALAEQLLLYLYDNIFPGTMKVPQSFLGSRAHRKILPFSRKYRAIILSPQHDEWTTYWPKYSFLEASGVDANYAAVAVANGARLALHFLAFVLPHAPPTSYRLLRLCQQPNINRFPWCVSPKLARAAAKAMKRYRNQFILKRAIAQSSDPRIVPENELTVQGLTDKTSQIELL